jgi:predicted phosphodiesterase
MCVRLHDTGLDLAYFSSMRIAAISDVHGNLRALEAVFADIDRQGEFDQIVCAGDHVFKGPFPRQTLELLCDRCDTLLEGNTDAYLSGSIDLSKRLKPGHWKHELLAWTKAEIGEWGVARLKGLPFELDFSPKRGRRLQFVHANPVDLEESLHPEAPASAIEALCRGITADILAFGHVHIPYVRKIGRLTLCDVASAGNPKDGDPRPAWTAFTFTTDRWTIEQRRVEYDLQAAARDHRESNMPAGEKLAQRLIEARYR